MNFSFNLRRATAVAALALAATGAAQAHTISAVSQTANFSFPAGTQLLPGAVSSAFFNAAGQRFIVHFTGECAVQAPAGNTSAWLDIDLQVLNAAGALVATLTPTQGSGDAFCSANGSAGMDGWSSNAVIGIGGPGLPAGVYRVRVQARTNNGATSGWIGQRSLIVTR